MLDDRIYRQFQSMPFEQQLQKSQQSVGLRETLLMNQIFKCGNDIFGSTQDDEKQDDRTTLRMSNDFLLSRKASQQKYIYEYDYGKDKNYKTQNNPYDDYSAQQISFTLSNQDNQRNSSKEHSLSPNPSFYIKDQNNHISWKNKLTEITRPRDEDISKQYLSQFIQTQLKGQISHQKVGKWKKPIKLKKDSIVDKTKSISRKSSPQKIEIQSPIKLKDLQYKKTFDLSNSKLNYFPDSVKKRKSIFQSKSPIKSPQIPEYLNYSSYYPQQKNPVFHTPQKNIMKRSIIPLSEQITKNVYGKLKQEVNGNSFIKEFETQQKKTQQESQKIWKKFIDRSDKWIQNKKNHQIQRQAMEKYPPNYSSTIRKDQNSSIKQYFSYADMKHQQKQSNNVFVMKFQQKKFQPQYTFSNKKRQKSTKKKESSVQNCINKLKTQTELLKVKLLSPLKNQIEDNEIFNHYKEMNEQQNKKLVRKFSSRQDNQFNKVLKDHSGSSQMKSFYGNCIGETRKGYIQRN